MNATPTSTALSSTWPLPSSPSDTYETASKHVEDKLNLLSSNLRLLRNSDGEIVGRGCLCSEDYGDGHPKGAVIVGGLSACSISGFLGVLAGQPKRASRDSATPIVEPAVLAAWASEQAKLVPTAFKTEKEQLDCSSLIRRFGGNTGDLPITKFRGKWVSAKKLATDKRIPEEVYLISYFSIRDYKNLPGFKLAENVLLAEYGSWHGILNDFHEHEWPEWPDKHFISWKNKNNSHSAMEERTLGGLVVETLAKAWGENLSNILSNSNFNGREKLTVGTVKGHAIKTEGIIIRRKANSSL